MPAAIESPHRIPIEALGADALPPARITLEQYHRLVETGALASGDPIEFLDGLLVRKMTKNPPHTTVVRRIVELLNSVDTRHHIVNQENPISLSASEPEPDFSIVRGEVDDYVARHPNGAECALVIEVADSSVRRDLIKADLYSEAAVPEYWIVDIDNRELIVHRRPTPDGYRDVSTVAEATVIVGDSEVRLVRDEVLAGL